MFECPVCGGWKDHKFVQVFGIRTLLCPNMPVGEIRDAQRPDVVAIDLRGTAAVE